ncbi:MAG: hypothetical protein U9Q04_06215 [Campylobacterota bacterium]|nr:hypothetical protein [Campylobacterota bacterium]
MRKLIFFITFLALVTSLNAKEYFYEHGKKVYIYRDKTKAATPQRKYYINLKNQTIIIRKDIMVKLKAFATVTAIIEEYELTVKKRYSKDKYLLSVQNIDDIFNIANTINKKTYVDYAYPKYFNKTLNDKYRRAGSGTGSGKAKGGSGSTSLGSGESISEAFKKR